MDKHTRVEARSSAPTWETLYEWLREKVRELLQELLEAEVTGFLGRARYERRAAVDAVGYRNGYGKPRKLTTLLGTMEVRRPRVRGVEERFESRILPLFVRRTKEVADLLPALYLHGLAEGDFDLALRGLLGEEAPLSASTVARLIKKYCKPQTEIRVMLYSKWSWKVFWIIMKYGKGAFWRAAELVRTYSEAQTGSPVTWHFSFRNIRRLRLRDS